MSEDVFDFRIAKLQRHIRHCHAEGRPVPSVYAPIEHDLSADNIRTWLEERDRHKALIEATIRHVAAQPDDAEFHAPWTA